jgi:hypothetical protein
VVFDKLSQVPFLRSSQLDQNQNIYTDTEEALAAKSLLMVHWGITVPS